jgi:hemoglobin-like flavoprotein/uncharacterized protein YjbI with pentapeptide repeats
MTLNIALLEQSFERIKPRADEFVASFYENLFAAHPEVRPLFANTEMEKQQKKLLNALVLVVENLRNPDALGEVLNLLGTRHIGYGAIPQHYSAVGQALLLSFEQYLQEDWTPELKKAWTDAYGAITAQMLQGMGSVRTTEENSKQETVPALPITTPATIQPTPSVPEKPATNAEEIPALAGSELPVELLEKSFEKIKPQAEKFVASFYENLFQAHPEVKPLFVKTDMALQQKKLLQSLVLVVENLRNPDALGAVLENLGARHIGYGTVPTQYGAVGAALLFTFEQYLQEDWTPEVKQAWANAFTAITKSMLKGASKDSAPTVVQVEKPAILSQPIPPQNQPETVAKSSTPTAETPQESQNLQSTAEPEKREIISIQLDARVLKELLNNLTVNYQKIQTQVSEQPFSKVLKQIPSQFSHTFWILPTWIVATSSAVIMAVVFVFTDDNSLFAEIISGVDAISMVVALILFIKEAPDRRKQFHYQAWSIIDAAHGVKVSYARILALQDLNEDSISLRGLDVPGGEFIDINLPSCNLSAANLSGTDFSNANLSHANLDKANLSRAKLSGANLNHATLSFTNMSYGNLSNANLKGANLICSDLSHASLAGANLKNASLSGANFKDAYLSGANLKGAQVSIAELSGAFLEGAIMPDGVKYKS